MLQSNGHLYLINSNELLIGKGACINTTSFIRSTFDVLDSDFLNGENLEFIGNSMSSIINYGTIHTKDGDALLIARHVENHGVLEAKGGRAGAIGCSSLL
ncbi:hypothetical protein [Candidatus Neptunichlamydia sp. REUL1]|uniref:hypothetical protein n=1 Tax=Candidatus Neptunichlamydia sp. REUL1 TaxID=3064277 RepID=UPI0029309928|nr:hypothetical protein [Candidatus Neptunochlamydia sp. REUL1]